MNNIILIWSFLDRSMNPWRMHGLYDNGLYYSGIKVIARFKFKSWKAK